MRLLKRFSKSKPASFERPHNKAEAFLGDDEIPYFECLQNRPIDQLYQLVAEQQRIACPQTRCGLSVEHRKLVVGEPASIEEMEDIFPGDPGWTGHVITVECSANKCPNRRSSHNEGMVGKTADRIVKLGDAAIDFSDLRN